MKKEKRKWQGIRINTFNALMIIVSAGLYLCLLMATSYTTQNYEQLVEFSDAHMRLEEAARTVLRSSDYLTEQVRMYVQTQEEDYAWKYFEEVTITKNRENALAVMSKHSITPSMKDELTLAVNESNELMVRELYAIALVAAAEGHAQTTALPVLAGTMLGADDVALTPEEKIEKARGMVFDNDYQSMKGLIYAHLDLFTQQILTTTELNLNTGLDNLEDAISTQRTLLTVLVFLNFLTFFVITLLVVRPLRSCIRSIRNRALFREIGAYEFRYLARIYNDINQRSDALAASEANLRSKVEKDEVTGLYNRPYFYKMVRERIKTSDEALYIVSVDISNFKIVNEHYGMKTGDRLLKEIGAQLQALDKNCSMIFARFVTIY